jgi:phage tail sheath protein FI
MPVQVTYPGVYIEEIPSGVRTIVGVATSITGFVGRAWKGPLDEPVKITSFADYERKFGGLWRDSALSYAVQQFFLNGGSVGIVVRVATRTGANAATAATIDLGGGNTFKAATPGTWGRNLKVTVDHKTKDAADTNLFNLRVLDDPETKADALKRGGTGLNETFLNVSRDAASPRFVTKALEQESSLVRATAVGAGRPAQQEKKSASNTSGGDGVAIIAADVEGDQNGKTGLYALERTDLFNLLCIPPLTPGENGNDVEMGTWTNAAKLCEERRALLIVDAPNRWTVSSAEKEVSAFSAIVRKNAALYFPRLKAADPLQENKPEVFAPCGVVAGIMSRTDAARGVWKAPAGIEANLQGAQGLSIKGVPAPVTITDKENGFLNPLGINCLRGFPGIGHVVWGARTLDGQDILASDWKYVPVRRLALYIEESLYRGTQWVVFEPNDEPLWAQIRLNVGAFMHNLFRQGAFQGRTPRDAYFVKCDKETTTQNDINLGIVNIVVGFAPLKPAEFVIIKIQQMVGQIET